MPAMPDPTLTTSAFSALSRAGASSRTLVPIQSKTLFSLLTFIGRNLADPTQRGAEASHQTSGPLGLFRRLFVAEGRTTFDRHRVVHRGCTMICAAIRRSAEQPGIGGPGISR